MSIFVLQRFHEYWAMCYEVFIGVITEIPKMHILAFKYLLINWTSEKIIFLIFGLFSKIFILISNKYGLISKIFKLFS